MERVDPKNCPTGSVIYAILCTATNRLYVGSSRNLKYRWYAHCRELKHGRHYTPDLQKDWNEYGPQEFELYILQQVDGDVPLYWVEHEWLWYYVTRNFPLYNVDSVSLPGRFYGKPKYLKIDGKVPDFEFRVKVRQ